MAVPAKTRTLPRRFPMDDHDDSGHESHDFPEILRNPHFTAAFFINSGQNQRRMGGRRPVMLKTQRKVMPSRRKKKGENLGNLSRKSIEHSQGAPSQIQLSKKGFDRKHLDFTGESIVSCRFSYQPTEAQPLRFVHLSLAHLYTWTPQKLLEFIKSES